MTTSRDTSRQRRANQNRSAREALVTRREAAQKEAAAEPTTGRSGRRASRAQSAPVVPSRTGRAAASSGLGFGPSERDAPAASGFRERLQQLAGGRQMLAGFVLVLAGSPFAAFVPMFRQKGHKQNESLVTLLGVRSLLFLVIPVVFAAIPLLTLNHRRRRLAWNVAAFLLGIWVLMTGLLAFYAFGLIAMIWGLMKASRAEGPAGTGFGMFRRPRRAAGDPSPVDVAGEESERGVISD